MFSKPSFFRSATARGAREPFGHTTTRGSDLFFGRSRDDSSEASGTLRAPSGWPAAYSAGSLTSISTARSRLIMRTASAALTRAPPPRPPTSVGQTSSPPETIAVAKRYQLSRTKLKVRAGRGRDPAKREL